MKKQILKTITFLGLLFSSNLFAITPPTQEYKEIVDSFKLIDTSEKELSQTFRVNGEEIKVELQKQEDEQFQWVQHIITKYKPYETTLGEPNEWVVVNKYDQKLLSVVCISPDKKTVLVSIARSSDYYKKKKQKLVIYYGYVAVGRYVGGKALNKISPTPVNDKIMFPSGENSTENLYLNYTAITKTFTLSGSYWDFLYAIKDLNTDIKIEDIEDLDKLIDLFAEYTVKGQKNE